jgi:hypothetical protein
MTASDADRAAAHALWNEILCNGGVPGWTATDAIAAALAEARATERAAADQLRTDVEKLVEEWEAEAEHCDVRASTYPPSGPWATEHHRIAARAATSRRAAARLRAILDAR